MTPALIFIPLLTSILVLFYIRLRRDRVEEYYEEPKPVPVKMGKYTIYLREEEFRAWEQLNRKAKRHYAQEFEKKVKEGLYYPVEQEDGTILYATKETAEWKK